MDRSKKLSETEYEIIEILWKSETPMSAAQLSSHFAEHHSKEWKASTHFGDFSFSIDTKGCYHL